MTREWEMRSDKRKKLILLASISVRVFSASVRIEASLITQRKPHGGLYAIRWTAFRLFLRCFQSRYA
jgi:hypothetical protein